MATTETKVPNVDKPAEGDVLAQKTADLSIQEHGTVTNPSTTEPVATQPAAATSTTQQPVGAGTGPKPDEAPTVPAAPAPGLVPVPIQEDAQAGAAKPAEALQRPLEHPTESSKPAAPPVLTEAETAKYEELLKTVQTWTEVPKTSGWRASKEPITDQDRLWLTRDQLLRYLRATKWDVPSAAKRLLATLTWRREYGLLGFTHEYISPENETGKQVILGYDNEARPCLYLNPARQNTERSDRQLHHLFYMIERVIDLMGPGQDSLALLVNFSDTRKGQGSTVGQARTTLYVLQNHYPERLGRALITELPWYIKTFFSLISSFIDPHTRTKLKFNEPLVDYVPAEQLLTTFGGKVTFNYDHSVYWPALDALCAQRRADYHARWVKAGKVIGENEVYLRGGDGKSVNGAHSGLEFPEGSAKEILSTV